MRCCNDMSSLASYFVSGDNLVARSCEAAKPDNLRSREDLSAEAPWRRRIRRKTSAHNHNPDVKTKAWTAQRLHTSTSHQTVTLSRQRSGIIKYMPTEFSPHSFPQSQLPRKFRKLFFIGRFVFERQTKKIKSCRNLDSIFIRSPRLISLAERCEASKGSR